MAYDLGERTAKFAERIVGLCRKISRDPVTVPIIGQLVRSGTSMGANYSEANRASSKKDFHNKIHICKKEAIETKYWLRILGKAAEDYLNECRELWKEAHELTLIFSKIAGSSK